MLGAHGAYLPWISAATTMLDSYVDQIEDVANGDHSYVAHYSSHEVAVQRICRLVRHSLCAGGHAAPSRAPRPDRGVHGGDVPLEGQRAQLLAVRGHRPRGRGRGFSHRNARANPEAVANRLHAAFQLAGRVVWSARTEPGCPTRRLRYGVLGRPLSPSRSSRELPLTLFRSERLCSDRNVSVSFRREFPRLSWLTRQDRHGWHIGT